MPEPRFYVAVTRGTSIGPAGNRGGPTNPERSGWVGVLDRGHLHSVVWESTTNTTKGSPGRNVRGPVLATLIKRAEAEAERLNADYERWLADDRT